MTSLNLEEKFHISERILEYFLDRLDLNLERLFAIQIFLMDLEEVFYTYRMLYEIFIPNDNFKIFFNPEYLLKKNKKLEKNIYKFYSRFKYFSFHYTVHYQNVNIYFLEFSAFDIPASEKIGSFYAKIDHSELSNPGDNLEEKYIKVYRKIAARFASERKK